MATTLYFTNDETTDRFSARKSADLLTAANTSFRPMLLSPGRGSGVVSALTGTVNGPTAGVEVDRGLTRGIIHWLSPPLAADITISGSITWNLRASESNMSANVAINGRIEVIDGATGAITLIDQTARTTELAITTEGVNNFAETPAAGVACKRGDRLRVRIFGDDAGTMATGFDFTFWWNGTTGGASGDSFITLTENLTFEAEPAGTTIYLTNTASAVATADVDREAWTARGAGVQNDVTNTTTGDVTVQVTDTAGGTAVSWFTRGLAAMTLGGACRVNLRGNLSAAASSAHLGIEVARVASDGTSPTVWAVGYFSEPGEGTDVGELPTTETAISALIGGDDLAISDNQRLRIRLLLHGVPQNMITARTVTTYYAGTTGGASGDAFLTFSDVLAEPGGGPAANPPRRNPMAQLLAQAATKRWWFLDGLWRPDRHIHEPPDRLWLPRRLVGANEGRS